MRTAIDATVGTLKAGRNGRSSDRHERTEIYRWGHWVELFHPDLRPSGVTTELIAEHKTWVAANTRKDSRDLNYAGCRRLLDTAAALDLVQPDMAKLLGRQFVQDVPVKRP